MRFGSVKEIKCASQHAGGHTSGIGHTNAVTRPMCRVRRFFDWFNMECSNSDRAAGGHYIPGVYRQVQDGGSSRWRLQTIRDRPSANPSSISISSPSIHFSNDAIDATVSLTQMTSESIGIG
jgi:hypothetical protein